MICEGQTVLFSFPQTNQQNGKLRPALVLKKLPGKFNDWLICMISSQTHQYIPNIDNEISVSDLDFQDSGLKQTSIIRVSRLAVVEETILVGKLGQINDDRLNTIKSNLCSWVKSA